MTITTDDLNVMDGSKTGWGSPTWRVTVSIPDGWGGVDLTVFKLISTKGMGGLKDGQRPRNGGGIHIYGASETEWFGVMDTFELDAALVGLCDFLNRKLVGIDLVANAPLAQLSETVRNFIRACEIGDRRDPREEWDMVLALVTEIGARMGQGVEPDGA